MPIYKGDVGTKLVIDVGVNVSEINVAKIFVKKPNNTKVEWTAEKESGTNNIFYVLENGDFDIAGEYILQPYLELASGWKGRGSEIRVEVKDVV